MPVAVFLKDEDRKSVISGIVTACLTVLACLTQPLGQAAYGVLFQYWVTNPAVVLLGAGTLSALVLSLLAAQAPSL